MSQTRRTWIVTMVATAVSTVSGLGRHASATPQPRPRPKAPRPGEPGYRTRWIGHY